jgi:hypothetical protein
MGNCLRPPIYCYAEAYRLPDSRVAGLANRIFQVTAPGHGGNLGTQYISGGSQSNPRRILPTPPPFQVERTARELANDRGAITAEFWPSGLRLLG